MKKEKFLLIGVFFIYIITGGFHLDSLLEHFASIPNEVIYVPALNIACYCDVKPILQWYKYPTFLVYVLAFFYWLILKLSPSTKGMVCLHINLAPAYFVIAGRFLSLIAGGIGLFLFYKMVRRVMEERWAIISSLFLAIHPSYLSASTMLYFDIFHTSAVIGVFYYIIKMIGKNRKKDLLICCLFAGLSLSTRFNFLTTLPIFIWWLLFSERKPKDLFIILFLPPVLFFILCPDFLFKLKGLIPAMKAIVQRQREYGWDMVTPFLIEPPNISYFYLYHLIMALSVVGPYFVFSIIHAFNLYKEKYLFWIFIPYILLYFFLVSSLAGVFPMPLYYMSLIPLFIFLSIHFIFSLKNMWIKTFLLSIIFFPNILILFISPSLSPYNNLEKAMDEMKWVYNKKIILISDMKPRPKRFNEIKSFKADEFDEDKLRIENPDYIIVDYKLVSILLNRGKDKVQKEFYKDLLSNRLDYKTIKVIEPSSRIMKFFSWLSKKISSSSPPYPVYILRRYPRRHLDLR
jgi:hypothetical protein